MTKFMNLKGEKKRKVKKKTVFSNLVTPTDIIKAQAQPKDWDNVLFIGSDGDYGDVFKAWDDDSPGEYGLFFGTKGDEFPD